MILLDVVLPGIDGIEVCRRLRARGSATPVVILTAHWDLDRVSAGADEFFPKPFSFDELVGRLREIA